MAKSKQQELLDGMGLAPSAPPPNPPAPAAATPPAPEIEVKLKFLVTLDRDNRPREIIAHTQEEAVELFKQSARIGKTVNPFTVQLLPGFVPLDTPLGWIRPTDTDA